MSNKIWNFDILVDDCFVNFNTKKQEINPDHNDRLLSVANGFEDGSWRYRQFKEFVFSNIAETALSAQEREKLIDNDYLLRLPNIYDLLTKSRMEREVK